MLKKLFIFFILAIAGLLLALQTDAARDYIFKAAVAGLESEHGLRLEANKIKGFLPFSLNLVGYQLIEFQVRSPFQQ